VSVVLCPGCQKPTTKNELVVRLAAQSKTPLFCSDACAKAQSTIGARLKYEDYIALWLKKEVTGRKSGGVLSSHVRRYVLEGANRQCSLCGWSGVNPTTGRSVVQVDHIDGDWEHSRPENLRAICPNCHAMTPNQRRQPGS